MTAPAILILGRRSEVLARRIASAVHGARIHAPACTLLTADVAFTKAITHLASLFREGTPIIGICAAGILIRAVAPHLADKRREPPVIAVAEDGSAVVPLLGGHRGANDLAATIAAALGIRVSVTTAGDARFGVALDAPPPGWTLAEPDRTATFMAAVLEAGAVALDVESGDASWLSGSQLPITHDAENRIIVTHRVQASASRTLVYHPPTLALGVGCERSASAEELIDLVEDTLAANGLAPASVACVVSLDLKADEPAVHALAARLVRPARFFAASELAAETPRLANPSEAVFRETGCHGVAEGAALAAGGAASTLIVPKTRGTRTTCAVALVPDGIDAGAVGQARGTLHIVGIGPGTPDWRTPEADAWIAGATDLVGYGLYLDLLGTKASEKQRHDFPLGAEEERCRHALDLAASGLSVALISSGDAGIYAMAALVYELLDRSENTAWRRVEVAVTPGISALQAAAARVGAPLGHDFCAISLSDLLTPWAEIERRLEAAAMGDFVVALYNPVSGRRRVALERAKAILGAARPAGTPVVIARNLGRAEEWVSVLTLGGLEVDVVDMLSIVLVGSSRTRHFADRNGRSLVYTPRGYPVP